MSGLKDDIGMINDEIVRVAADKLTGKININIHMTQGSIGQINVIVDRNLKKKSAISAKNDNF